MINCRAAYLTCCIAFCTIAGPARVLAADCESAIASASHHSGIPAELLYALALTESGRAEAHAARPWPWTLNDGGEGRWFDTRAEAELALADLISEGRSNIDIGCFQLNLRWHGEAFLTPAEMLDPGRNADYAARFLLDLYHRSGSWDQAVASYHSATKELAEIYMNRFVPIYAEVLDRPIAIRENVIPLASVTEADRVNLYPLLREGMPATAGSLMPVSEARSPLIDPS